MRATSLSGRRVLVCASNVYVPVPRSFTRAWTDDTRLPETLETRLRSRGTEGEEDIQKRLAQARVELEYADTGFHDKIIVNDDLETAYVEFEEFVYKEPSQDGKVFR
jgi:ribose 1,5-bisphosphokinase PhnN